MKPCEEVQELLGDHLDRQLSPDESQQIDDHLAECAACNGHFQDAVSLRAAVDRLPRAMELRGDLWPKILAQLETPRNQPLRGLWSTWRMIALAASVLVVVGAVLYLKPPWRSGELAPTGIAGHSGSDGVRTEMAKAEQAFESAASDLLAELKATASALTPDVRETVEGNLHIANRAISDIKSALKQQPNDVGLARKLLVAHERRLEMLQYVTQISMSTGYGG